MGYVELFHIGAKPKTEHGKPVHMWCGESDALACRFCGALTCPYEHFMFMQML